MDERTQEQVERGRMLAAASNSIVRLHARHYGKGPTRARAFTFDDFVLCLLRDPFTTVESTFAASGKGDALRDNRMIFYETMEPEFVEAVASVTGRNVVAFMPGINVDPPVVSMLFLLEPQ